MSGKIPVYLDSCCFIDVVKFDASAKLEDGREKEVWYIKKLLQAHKDGKIIVFTSTLTIAEAVHTGETPVPDGVQEHFDSLLNSGQYVQLVQPTPFTFSRARDLRWKDEIAVGGADGVHLATALEKSCSEFHSMDRRFGRIDAHKNIIENKGLKVCRPSETKVLPAE